MRIKLLASGTWHIGSISIAATTRDLIELSNFDKQILCISICYLCENFPPNFLDLHIFSNGSRKALTRDYDINHGY